MGFWEEIGKAALQGMASYGHTDQIISKLKEAPKSRWPDIIDSAIDEAERMSVDMGSWSKTFSDRLAQLQDEDPRFEGIHWVCIGVYAKRGLQRWADSRNNS